MNFDKRYNEILKELNELLDLQKKIKEKKNHETRS